MRILVISNLYPPAVRGGYEILCQLVCNELAARGHNLHVITTPVETPLSTVTLEPALTRSLQLYLPFDSPARIARHRRRKTSRFNYVKTMETIVRTSPDIIFIWSQLRLTLGAAKAAEDSLSPVLYAINDTHLTGYLAAHFSYAPRTFLRWIRDSFFYSDITLNACALNHITCISASLRDSLHTAGISFGECRVIHHGIPLDLFPLKKSPGSVSNPASVLYTGQLHAYKGVHTLLDAIALAEKNIPGKIGRVSVVGSGDRTYTDELKNIAARITAPVHFIERIPHEDMPEVYRSHDIFVFPSIWNEPFGLTHIEAMASGTPVITTAHGGQSECFTDGENALFFEKDNPIQLALCIQRLIEDSHCAAALAKNARNLVESQLSLNRYVDELELYLKELAG